MGAIHQVSNRVDWPAKSASGRLANGRSEALPPVPTVPSFQQAADRYRAELQFHCYRMMGSIHDAEDMVQETMLRAWKGYRAYEGRASVRNWLYRIATNTCLNGLASRARHSRHLPPAITSPTRSMPDGEPASDIPWLEPYPDALLENIADPAPAPNARHAMRDTVRLAFVAAIQWLPPRQRAVLLLRDVLGWSADDTGRALEISSAAVTSALQRARATLATHLTSREFEPSRSLSILERHLIERYVTAWESADLHRFIELLQEEATLAMPPWQQWYRGRDAIRKFFAWAFDWAWSKRDARAFRMIPIFANGQAALAFYLRNRGESNYHAHAIQIPEIAGGRIVSLTLFLDPSLFEKFQLAPTLPANSIDAIAKPNDLPGTLFNADQF